MDAKLQIQQDHNRSDLNSNDSIGGEGDRQIAADYLDIVRKLRLDLTDKSNECELLRIRVDESENDAELLSRELNECKLAMFENNEDSRKNLEEVLKSKKLEEDYVKLMSDFLDLGERSDQYKLNLLDNYLAKSNAINNIECLMTSGALSSELEEYQVNLDNSLAELNLTQAKVRNLEEENVVKEKSITELRKSLEDAKITHKHEITVLEEYIHCLKNTITSYEKTLASYIESPSKPPETSAHNQ